jgi:hypothetical protein
MANYSRTEYFEPKTLNQKKRTRNYTMPELEETTGRSGDAGAIAIEATGEV